MPRTPSLPTDPSPPTPHARRLPNAPWPPFRVYDLCTGAWLSFCYEDVTEVRLPLSSRG